MATATFAKVDGVALVASLYSFEKKQKRYKNSHGN